MVKQTQRTPFGVMQNVIACPTCQGSGENTGDYCVSCHGNGCRLDISEVAVKVPRGIDSGATLRVKGHGHMGRRSGLIGSSVDTGPSSRGNKGGSVSSNVKSKKDYRGDLFVHITVAKHPKFKREGDGIYTEESLSYVDAIVGKTIRAEMVDGTVEVKVPPGIQPEQKLRLKGKGAFKLSPKGEFSSSSGSSASGVRGDAFIKIKVQIPTKLEEREKELIGEIAKLYHPEQGTKERETPEGDGASSNKESLLEDSAEIKSGSSSDVGGGEGEGGGGEKGKSESSSSTTTGKGFAGKKGSSKGSSSKSTNKEDLKGEDK
jgi:molecular chaperone DnaJ